MGFEACQKQNDHLKLLDLERVENWCQMPLERAWVPQVD
jgi:hypothetical protein